MIGKSRRYESRTEELAIAMSTQPIYRLVDAAGLMTQA
jgi:hypothetical protein